MLVELQNLSYLVENVMDVEVKESSNLIYVELTIQGKQTKQKYIVSGMVSKDYPLKQIKFYETTEKIPRIVDRHVNPDNSLCLESPLNMHKYFENGKYLISDYVYLIDNFIQADEYYQCNGGYEYENYSHGLNGILESLHEHLSYEFTYNVIYVLLFRLLIDTLKENNLCVCGSGKIIASCHDELVNDIKDIYLDENARKSILMQVYPLWASIYYSIKSVTDPTLRFKVKWKYPQLESKKK